MALRLGNLTFRRPPLTGLGEHSIFPSIVAIRSGFGRDGSRSRTIRGSQSPAGPIGSGRSAAGPLERTAASPRGAVPLKIQALSLVAFGLVATSFNPGQEGLLAGRAYAVIPVIDAPAEAGILVEGAHLVQQIGQVTQIIGQVTSLINFASTIARNGSNIFGAIGAVGLLANMAGFTEMGGTSLADVQAYAHGMSALMTAGTRLENSVNNLQSAAVRLQGTAGSSFLQLTENPLGQSFAGSTVPLFDRITNGYQGAISNFDSALGSQVWARQQLSFSGIGTPFQVGSGTTPGAPRTYNDIRAARDAEFEAAALDGYGIGVHQMVSAGRVDERMTSLFQSVNNASKDEGCLRCAVAAETSVDLALLEELSQLRSTDAALLRLLSAQALATHPYTTNSTASSALSSGG